MQASYPDAGFDVCDRYRFSDGCSDGRGGDDEDDDDDGVITISHDYSLFSSSLYVARDFLRIGLRTHLKENDNNE